MSHRGMRVCRFCSRRRRRGGAGRQQTENPTRFSSAMQHRVGASCNKLPVIEAFSLSKLSLRAAAIKRLVAFEIISANQC